VDGVRRVELAAIQFPPQLVGSARIIQVDTDTPILADVFVHPDLRRLGIGSLLVEAARAWAESQQENLYLHVRPNNPARKLYEAQGFKYTGEVNESGSCWMVKMANGGRIEEVIPQVAIARQFVFDVTAFERIAGAARGPVVMEHEDLFDSPQYDLLKPFAEEDRARGTGQLMVQLVNGKGDTLGDLWLLFTKETIRFSRPPQVRVGSLRIPCGREVQVA
jgi:hypothetical protein